MLFNYTRIGKTYGETDQGQIDADSPAAAQALLREDANDSWWVATLSPSTQDAAFVTAIDQMPYVPDDPHATEALYIGRAAWAAIQGLIDSGAATPEILQALAVTNEALPLAQAAYNRNDAAGVVQQIQRVRQAAISVGIPVMPVSDVQMSVQPQAVAYPIDDLSASPSVTDLPTQTTVLSRLGADSIMTIGELDAAISQGYQPLRADGTPFIVTPFMGGNLLDGAPLNVWLGPGWYVGQQEALQPYWTSGAIPMPPAGVLNQGNVIPMPAPTPEQQAQIDAAARNQPQVDVLSGGISLPVVAGALGVLWLFSR